MILQWIRRRGSGSARRAAARFRRSVAEPVVRARAAARPPLRLGGTTHESSEPLLRCMGRNERRRRDPAAHLLAAGRRQDGSNAVRACPRFGRDAAAHALRGRRDVLRPERPSGVPEPTRGGGLGPGRLRLLPGGACRPAHVQRTPPTNLPSSSRSVPGASRTSSPIPNTDMPGWRLAILSQDCSRVGATPGSSLALRSRSSSRSAGSTAPERRGRAGDPFAQPAPEPSRRLSST